MKRALGSITHYQFFRAKHDAKARNITLKKDVWLYKEQIKRIVSHVEEAIRRHQFYWSRN